MLNGSPQTIQDIRATVQRFVHLLQATQPLSVAAAEHDPEAPAALDQPEFLPSSPVAANEHIAGAPAHHEPSEAKEDEESSTPTKESDEDDIHGAACGTYDNFPEAEPAFFSHFSSLAPLIAISTQAPAAELPIFYTADRVEIIDDLTAVGEEKAPESPPATPYPLHRSTRRRTYSDPARLERANALAPNIEQCKTDLELGYGADSQESPRQPGIAESENFLVGRKAISGLAGAGAILALTLASGGFAAPLIGGAIATTCGYAGASRLPSFSASVGVNTRRMLGRADAENYAVYDDRSKQLLLVETLPIHKRNLEGEQIQAVVDSSEAQATTPSPTPPAPASDPNFIEGRRIVTAISTISGFGAALIFTGGMAILPAAAIAAASATIGFNAAVFIPRLSNRLGRLMSVRIVNQPVAGPVTPTEVPVTESARTRQQHAEAGSGVIGAALGTGALTLGVATGTVTIVPAILGAAAIGKGTSVLANRGWLGVRTTEVVGRFTTKHLEKYARYNVDRMRPSKYGRPDTMPEAEEMRAYQDQGMEVVVKTVAASIGVLTLFSGGGAVFAPQAAAAAYIAAEGAVRSFMISSTFSERTPSLSRIGDHLAIIGRAAQEMKGAAWSFPTLLLSKFVSDRLAKSALQSASAVNFVAAMADTCTAIRLTKKIPPTKIEGAMRYNRVRYKFYRALAWGILFDAGICLIVNTFIPPLGLASLKIQSYYLSALVFGTLGCTTLSSYCCLKYLDKITFFCSKLYAKYGKKEKVRQPDILFEQDDFLFVQIDLVKGLGTYDARKRYREALYVKPKNDSAIFAREDFADQAALDNFNETVKKNAIEKYGENSKETLPQLKFRADDGALIVKNITIFSQREGQSIKISPNGIETKVENSSLLGEEKAAETQATQDGRLAPGQSVGLDKYPSRPPLDIVSQGLVGAGEAKEGSSATETSHVAQLAGRRRVDNGAGVGVNGPLG